MLDPERIQGLVGDEGLFITELLVVNESRRGSYNCSIFMCEFVVMVVIMGVGLLRLMQGISSLFITVRFECKGITRLHRERGKVAYCRRRSRWLLLGTSGVKSGILNCRLFRRVMSLE